MIIRDDEPDERAAEQAMRESRRDPTIVMQWDAAWEHVLCADGNHGDDLCATVGCSLCVHGAWRFNHSDDATPRDRERWRRADARTRWAKRADARAAFGGAA